MFPLPCFLWFLEQPQAGPRNICSGTQPVSTCRLPQPLSLISLSLLGSLLITPILIPQLSALCQSSPHLPLWLPWSSGMSHLSPHDPGPGMCRKSDVSITDVGRAFSGNLAPQNRHEDGARAEDHPTLQGGQSVCLGSPIPARPESPLHSVSGLVAPTVATSLCFLLCLVHWGFFRRPWTQSFLSPLFAGALFRATSTRA